MAIQARQRGVILVFLVIIIAVLLGIAAFSLDIGRLLVLKTEMQNAVDAAALAGAKELDSQSGAVVRAKAAALGLIRKQSHFAKDKEILSSELQEGEEVVFRFYCAIENDLDENGQVKGDCGDNFVAVNEDSNGNEELDSGEDLNGNGRLDHKVEVPFDHADADTYVHYIEVRLNPKADDAEASDRYKIPLFFLPALRVLGLNTPTEAATSTRALAGRQYFPCRYPPVMICDPSEDYSLPQLDVGDEGRMVILKEMTGSNSTWAPGSFGFLVPAACLGPDGKSTCTGKQYKDEFAKQLANEADMGCSPPYVSTDPGNYVDIKPINTRFGLGSTSDNPAAPNVVDYPHDDNFISSRYGDGNMLLPAYSTTDPLPSTLDQLRNLSEEQYRYYYFATPVAGMSRPVRYAHYMSEIESGNLPSFTSTSISDCKDVDYDKNPNSLKNCRNLRGDPGSVPIGEANRRVLYVASLKCNAQNIKGNVDYIYVPPPPAGWKKFFLTEHVEPPPSGDKVSYYAEYIGNADETDGNFDVVIQLYE